MKGQEHPAGFPLWPGRQSVEHIVSLGESWRVPTEDYLVGALAYLPEAGKPEGQAAAAAELQRRLSIAIREFNQQSKIQTDALIELARESGRQNVTMIHLTQWVIALTVILGVLAALQLLRMLL